MKNSISLNNIRKDLKFLQDFWVIIYGSCTNEDFFTNRSDIDIAIITHTDDKQKNLEIWQSLLGKAPVIYDLRIFELFTLYIQIDIIKNYKVLFGDHLEISEYFYKYRKIWKDMAKRVELNQFQNIQEKLELIERRKNNIF